MTHDVWAGVELPRPTTDLERACRDLSDFGYCTVSDVLDPDATAAIRERVLRQAAAERAAGLDHEYQAEAEGDEVNQWVYQLANKGEVLHQLPVHGVARRLASHVLGREYLLSSFDSHITRPGNLTMPLHADQWWMPQPMTPGGDYDRQGDITRSGGPTGSHEPADHPITPPLILNVMWMITDFTVANGATRVVPRSHLSGNRPDPSLRHPEVPVEGAAGSIVAWDGRTWHAAGLNTSDEPRVGITTYFGGPMVRQLSNGTYGLRSEVRTSASPELLALLGFRPFSSYGMTDDPDCEHAAPGDDTAGELTTS